MPFLKLLMQGEMVTKISHEGIILFKNIKSRIRAWNEKQRKARERLQEAIIQALCEHLGQIGLEATMISFKTKPHLGGWGVSGEILGAVRIANRNINLIELVEWFSGGGDAANERLGFGCTYLVQMKMDGLEDAMNVESKPVRKGVLSREILDFKWEEKDSKSWILAGELNNDYTLRNMLYPKDKLALKSVGSRLPAVQIKAHGKHRCVRIMQKSYAKSPAEAFPTIETFEAFERIANHIRSGASIC